MSSLPHLQKYSVDSITFERP
jgi:hypothetical protein